MKKIYLITTILFVTFIKLNAQTIDVVEATGPWGLTFDGDELYISEYTKGDKISQFNVTSAATTAIDLIIGPNEPTASIIIGDYLYISEYSGNKISKFNLVSASRTSKTDLTAETSTLLVDVVTGLDNPYELVLNGNDLYIAEYDSDKISKIDITDASPTAIDVVTGLSGPVGLLLNGNDLYIAEFNGSKVSKIDITDASPTATDVVTGLSSPVGLILRNNDLYISEFSSNKISKIDITDASPTTTDVATDLLGPAGLALKDNELYISQYNNRKVSKIILPKETLSINEDILTPNILISPNPANDFLSISNLTETTNYTIYNIVGNELLRGNISTNEKIDIQNLTSGIYFLKFENKNTVKFVKQ